MTLADDNPVAIREMTGMDGGFVVEDLTLESKTHSRVERSSGVAQAKLLEGRDLKLEQRVLDWKAEGCRDTHSLVLHVERDHLNWRRGSFWWKMNDCHSELALSLGQLPKWNVLIHDSASVSNDAEDRRGGRRADIANVPCLEGANGLLRWAVGDVECPSAPVSVDDDACQGRRLRGAETGDQL